ncbi:MAG: hypothetical protein ACRCX2_22685 [Paraclostridium sp.]
MNEERLFTVSESWLRSVGVKDVDIESVNARYSRTMFWLSEDEMINNLYDYIERLSMARTLKELPDDVVHTSMSSIVKIFNEMKLDRLTLSDKTYSSLDNDILFNFNFFKSKNEKSYLNEHIKLIELLMEVTDEQK